MFTCELISIENYLEEYMLGYKHGLAWGGECYEWGRR